MCLYLTLGEHIFVRAGPACITIKHPLTRRSSPRLFQADPRPGGNPAMHEGVNLSRIESVLFRLTAASLRQAIFSRSRREIASKIWYLMHSKPIICPI